MIELSGCYDNISQRVACSYIRSMAELDVAGMDGSTADSARDLHAFFQAFYQRLYDAPAEFGLSTAPDDCITGSEPNGTERKAELLRKLKKPREAMVAGIEFLMLAGSKGQLSADGCSLALGLDDYSAYLGNSRSKKQFLKGFSGAGLAVIEGAEGVVLTSARFPRMFPALKALAEAGSQAADPRVGQISFAHCDFRVLDPAFKLSPRELYRVFNPQDYERVARLDAYFIARGYKPTLQVNSGFEWCVDYQGRRSVKGSPLMRIGYSERLQRPMQVSIKCASSKRILPLLPQQSRALQEDFSRRVFNCNGDACGWCKTRPHLGPSVYEFDGVTRTICWFSNQDIRELNDETEALIHEYAELHEALG